MYSRKSYQIFGDCFVNTLTQITIQFSAFLLMRELMTGTLAQLLLLNAGEHNMNDIPYDFL